jgi:hypothetical protein
MAHNSGNEHLNRLGAFLNFELSSSTFYLFGFFYSPLLFIAVIAAILFTPYMIYVLIIEKRTGWLIFFFLLVLLPLATSEIFISDPLIKALLRFVPLALFYLYCILLKFSVNDWIRERAWKQLWLSQKLEKENTIKSELL